MRFLADMGVSPLTVKALCEQGLERLSDNVIMLSFIP
ncbi:hypothetical protein Xen7305DRAFT_00050130 [Xenococcus sp. PCC 7305]|nr:hypothetical protein Xen7305DRAFT_00050130 [Xenococcus sp. PCC 7305]